MSSSADTMVQHAVQTQAMAAQLAGVSAFDPSMFQAPMMAGLGPVGAPFAASFMAALTNHVANAAEQVAALEAHGAAVQASSQAYSDTEGDSSDAFDSVI
ncbi:type VII secretion target [Segniliparus rotundus]|nr:type VII secretion target [Segniliparus rotundus]